MAASGRLRADAARNRDAIVAAARLVFGEQGLDASLDEIARTAGVGNATLYRRFPSRADLIAEVFADRLREHAEAIEAAAAEPDAWSAFASYVEAACRIQVHDRGLADLVTMQLSHAPALEAMQDRAYRGFVRLVRRAKRAGTLRADFEPQDLLIVLMANAGLVERAGAASEDASARLTHLLLDGLRTGAATPGPRPPSSRRVNAARARALGGAMHTSAGEEHGERQRVEPRER
jgi:AcrR family transcriptional regulator